MDLLQEESSSVKLNMTINEFEVSFTLKQEPKESKWRLDWDEKQIAATINRHLTEETGGHKLTVEDMMIKRKEKAIEWTRAEGLPLGPGGCPCPCTDHVECTRCCPYRE